MLRDFLKDSWTFQETLEEGREQGLEEGREQGLEEGREQGLRQSIEALVLARFPDLLASVQSPIASQKNLPELQEILICVGTAKTEDEIRQFLSTLRKKRQYGLIHKSASTDCGFNLSLELHHFW